MHNNEVIFDIEQNRIGIATANCDLNKIDNLNTSDSETESFEENSKTLPIVNSSSSTTIVPVNSSEKAVNFLDFSKLKHPSWMIRDKDLSLTNTVSCFFKKNTLLYSIEVLLIFLSLASLVLSFFLIMATTFFRRKTNFLFFKYSPESYSSIQLDTSVNNQSVVHDTSVESEQV